jgi:hypothetical protein
MPEVGINVMAAGVHDASEVERAITVFRGNWIASLRSL